MEQIPQCICCDAELPQGQLCSQCEELLLKDAVFGQAYPGCYAAYWYNDIVSRIVARFKYENDRWLAEYMGAALWSAVANVAYDAVSFVPLHKKRFAQRGYNQAELLARYVARMAGKPCLDILARTRVTRSQALLPHEARRANVEGAFSLIPAAGVQRLRVLLIDDVITTGATIAQCALLLQQAGAEVICGAFAAARKPLHFPMEHV